MKRLTVVGLGYVGLPLAREGVRAGLEVTGLDASARTVAGLNAGRSHVDDLGHDDIRSMLESGFEATGEASVVADADVVVICVPTPLSDEGGPDLSAVEAAGRSIARHLRPGTLVVLESTTYPGTTEEVLRPILETSGLRAGHEFHLAYSPERIDPGNPHFTLANTPKVVGGYTEACTVMARDFYRQVVQEVVTARSTREAEAAKLLENTYRHVNIALVNELTKVFHELDVDVWDVIRLASSKPFGFQAFTPGPGVGGHCIPIDPHYLSHRVRSRLGYPLKFVELAEEVNARMPEYVVERAGRLLAERGLSLHGAQVLLLGVTYKADIADERESPARDVAAELRRRGACVRYHDPLVLAWDEPGAQRVDDVERGVLESDVTLLLQAHSSYDVDLLAEIARCLLDTRGVTPVGSPAHRI